MRTTVLFDLDGTLLDTSPGIFATANHTMTEMGFKPLPPSQLRKFVGPPLAACFRVACGLDEPLVARACDIYRARYVQGAMFNAEIYPGILELLERLIERGLTLGVATLKLEPLARTILEHFELAGRFSVIVGTDPDGKLSKSDIIQNALAGLGVEDRGGVLMVGDTPHDLDGAAAAGVDFIGVDWGFGFSRGHRLERTGHVLGTIDDPGQLLEFIGR